jgi:hypothetical protein
VGGQFFGGRFFAVFWDLFLGEGIPQGLKPLLSLFAGRPKAEALGYIEATARAKADAYGMTNKKGNGKGKKTTARAKAKYRDPWLRSG